MLGIENKYKQFRDLNKILIKPCVARKQNCKFRILPFQPCGNPVFMRVQRISPTEKPCVCAQPG
ncbi:hypothetical protein ACSLOD_28255, partial [Escherichia coli]